MKSGGLRFTLICLATMATPIVASAQAARTGVPEVLTPPSPPPADNGESAMRRFRAAISERGQKRIAVFWNRAFSDQLSTSREDFVRTRETSRSGSTEEHDSSHVQVGDTDYRQQDTNASREEEVTRGTRTTDAGSRRSLKEPQEWELRGAFDGTMLQGGALLVDRNLAMRTISVGNRDDDDAQKIETAALIGKADLLLEILVSVDSTTPSGLMFFVTAKRIADGSLVASFATAAVRPSTSQRSYVAGPGGFQQVHAPAPTLRDAGRELALETMWALSGP